MLNTTHSDAYSCLGYISGYLRYYYPIEFLTAALNIFNDNAEKTAEITKYANKVGIKVTTPKWGFSRGKYYYNKEKMIIAKDLTSVKYMNEKIADDMFNLAKENEYKTFIDVLIDLFSKTSIDSQKLDILIKIDFFSDFGNQRELLRITELFLGMFKKGTVKQIKRDAVAGSPLAHIVEKYSIGVTKAGGIAKSYTVLDVDSIMREAEESIKASHMQDLSDIIKVRNFADIMGYVGYISHKEEDRRKLYVLDTYPVARKSDGKRFGYSVITKSIGSGVEARFTVLNPVYDKDPIKKGDVIYCEEFEKDGKYFKLRKYSKIF